MAKKLDLTIEDESKLESKDEDFDFDDFYTSDEDDSEEEQVEEELGISYDEEAYEEVLDLHSDKSNIAVEAKFPYIRISGFVIKDEIEFMQKAIKEYVDSIRGLYNDDNMVDIMMNVNSEDYMVDRVPLTLDTFLTIFKAHRYEVSIVRGHNQVSQVTSELMKAFLFT